MEMSDQRHAPAALYHRGKDPGTHCTRGWVGPTAGLDSKVRGKIICLLCRGSNLDRPEVQSIVDTILTELPRILILTVVSRIIFLDTGKWMFYNFNYNTSIR
jgi:hypothetical protein